MEMGPFRYVWALPIPPKISIFLWLLLHNRILTKNNLSRRGWSGDMKCHFCPDMEDTNHLFLNYQQAKKIWFWLGRTQDCFDTWDSLTDIFDFSTQFSYDK